MFYVLVWPTPEAVWKAAEICRTNNQMPDAVIETGRRSVADTLGLVRKTGKKAEIVIVAPFVCNDEVCKHLQAILKAGGKVHWYGAPDLQVEKNLHLRLPGENQLLKIIPYCITPPLEKEIKQYLRYKITLTFLGDEDGEVHRKELNTAIVNLAKDPSSIPPEETNQVNTFVRFSFPAIEGQSAGLKKLKRDIHRVAKAGLSNVLLLGETGTGKEATAFFLHNLDPGRCKNKIGAISCAGLQEEYLISELFGHVTGAYTDARDRKGLIATLNGGTLFLDELPDMPARVQSMLLRFLETGEYTPMGSDEPQKANVKIVAGGQHELLCEKLRLKEFRKDLYYRLAGKVLTVPSLRDIVEDLPILIDHLVYKMEEDSQKRNDALQYFEQRSKELKDYHWPGNTRELANYVRRRLTLGKDEDIILGEYEIEEKSQKTTSRPQQNLEAQGYCVDVTFGKLFPDEGVEKSRAARVNLERPDDVKNRYIKHVYKCLKDEGESNSFISAKLGISINTLKKAIKTDSQS